MGYQGVTALEGLALGLLGRKGVADVENKQQGFDCAFIDYCKAFDSVWRIRL